MIKNLNRVELRPNLIAMVFIYDNCDLAALADDIQKLEDVKRVTGIKRYDENKKTIIVEMRLHYDIERAKKQIDNKIKEYVSKQQ